MSEKSQEAPVKLGEPYLAVEGWGYKGVALDFLGVYHNIVTFQAYKERFEQEISGNDAVLLEAAPRAEGLIDASGNIPESAIAELQKTRQVPPAEIREMLERLRPALNFFAEIEALAGEAGKDVLVFDPYSADPETEGAKVELQKRDFQLYLMRTIALTATPGYAIPGGIALAISQAKKKHNRRAFLAGGLAAVAGAAMLTSIAGGYHNATRFSTRESMNKSNPVTLSLADLDDYRDVAVTHVFTKLADQGQLDGRIAAVYGDGHRAQMRHYTQSPWQADLKLSTVYSGLAEISPPRYRRFAYRGGNTWAKTQDRVIK